MNFTEIIKTKTIGIHVLLAVVFLISVSCSEEDDAIATSIENTVLAEVDVEDESFNIVTEWTDLLVNVERYSAGRPNASARAMAYIYLAAFETAVPDIDGYSSNENRLRDLAIDDDEHSNDVDVQLALNTCFSSVLQHFLLNLPQNRIDQILELEQYLDEQMIENLSTEEVSDSRAWGEYVAETIISYSQTDTEAEEQILAPQPRSYEPETGNGYWTYSADPERALFPYWESARTFVVAPESTSSIPPITYSTDVNSEYYAEMMEIYTSNNLAKSEDNEDLWIAEFWSDDVEGLMISPPVRQISIANQLVTQQGLDMTETLELFVKLGFSLNDAAVATWMYKYEYMVMRPSVYIQDFIDASFQTNLFRLVYWPNPGFPGYPSGHSCFASAASGIFIDFFGDNITFTDETHDGRSEFRGDARTFSSMSEMAEENAFSRVPLGVHMPMDCEEGLRLGYEISDAVNSLNLQGRRGRNQ